MAKHSTNWPATSENFFLYFLIKQNGNYPPAAGWLVGCCSCEAGGGTWVGSMPVNSVRWILEPKSFHMSTSCLDLSLWNVFHRLSFNTHLVLWEEMVTIFPQRLVSIVAWKILLIHATNIPLRNSLTHLAPLSIVCHKQTQGCSYDTWCHLNYSEHAL